MMKGGGFLYTGPGDGGYNVGVSSCRDQKV